MIRRSLALAILVVPAACGAAEDNSSIFDANSRDALNTLHLIRRIAIDDAEDPGGIEALDWSPGSGSIAILSHWGENLKAFDAATGSITSDFDPSEFGVGADPPIAFVEDRTAVAGYSGDRRDVSAPRLAKWDLRTGRQIFPLSEARAGDQANVLTAANLVVRSHDGLVVVALMKKEDRAQTGGSADGRLEIFDTRTGGRIATIPAGVAGPDAVSALAVSADDNRVAIGTSDGSLSVFDIHSRSVSKPMKLRTVRISALEFDRTGDAIAIGYSPVVDVPPFSGVVEIRSTTTGQNISTLDMPSYVYRGQPAQPKVHSISWDWKSGRIAVATVDAVRVWSTPLSDPHIRFSQRMPLNGAGLVAFGYYQAKFSNQGKLAIAAGKTILVYD